MFLLFMQEWIFAFKKATRNVLTQGLKLWHSWCKVLKKHHLLAWVHKPTIQNDCHGIQLTVVELFQLEFHFIFIVERGQISPLYTIYCTQTHCTSRHKINTDLWTMQIWIFNKSQTTSFSSKGNMCNWAGLKR